MCRASSGLAFIPLLSLQHKHDAKKCDVIVCWVHDWAECPEWIEVVELRKVVEEMRNRGVCRELANRRESGN